MVPVIKIRDELNKFIDVAALKGKTLYDYALEQGFTGTEKELNEKLNDIASENKYPVQGESLEAIADEVRNLTNTTESLTPDEMISALDEVGDEFINQYGSLSRINRVVNGLPEIEKEFFYQEKTVIPSAEGQVVKPDNGYDGLSKVTVKGDEDLVPENIKLGVNIFGVEGEYKDYSIEDALVGKSLSIYTNDRIENIKHYIFAYCTSLTSVSFPACSYIGSSAFAYCTSLTSISFPACTSIGDYAFEYCSSLTNVSFPNCTNIGWCAFAYCSSLISVDFPNCTNIGWYAFENCTSLTIVSFPACISISRSAFANCSSLTSVSFPACKTIAGDTFAGAFQNCTSLKLISFPVCTSIGEGTFYGCKSLITADFPACKTISGSTVTNASGAFQNCTSLTSISFPKCTSIGSRAFQNCRSLTAVSFPACTNTMGNIFTNCTSLITVDFPVCSFIGYDAFSGCTALTSVSFPLCASIDGYAFHKCKSLISVSFPACKTICYGAFADCTSLISVSFPVGEKITYNNYYKTGAFQNCYNLSTIILNTPSVCTLSNSNAFASTPYAGYSASYSGTPYIYVPGSLVDAYKSATNWTYFSKYFSAIENANIISEEVQ